MTARLPQDQVDLLQRAAKDLDLYAISDPLISFDADRELASILLWVADPETSGPVLHQSALAIARAVLGED